MKKFKIRHPLVLMAWFGANILILFIFQHPVILIAQLFILIGIAMGCGIGRQLAVYMQIGFYMSFLVMLANVLFIHSGETILCNFRNLPIIGSIQISLEAILYGAMMSIRLLVVMGLFAIYNNLVSPERLIRLMKGKHSHMLVATVLSIRMMPLLMRDVKRVIDVYRCRGVRFETGGLVNRVKSMHPLVGVVLQSSLERAFSMAESMTARGYGLSGRTALRREKFGCADYILLASVVFTMLVALAFKCSGVLSFNYYPIVSPLQWGFDKDGMKTGIGVLVLCIGLIFPVIQEGGWSSEGTVY